MVWPRIVEKIVSIPRVLISKYEKYCLNPLGLLIGGFKFLGYNIIHMVYKSNPKI